MMNGPKRSSIISKYNVRYNGKLKETLSTRHKPDGKLAEADLTNIPIIKQIDNAKLLPKYAPIVAKSGDDGISMDDLDQLQQDLEKLLSTSAIRTRYLLTEIGEVDRNDEGHDRKAHDKTSLKRKRPDDKPKYKDLKNGMRVIKKHCVNKFIGDSHLNKDIPKVTLPKNDNFDKFWASIEPYCAHINKDDVVFLDGLIQELSRELDIKVPEIGEHYANSWSEEVIFDEQTLGKSPSKKIASNHEIKKNGVNSLVETFSTPQTQRLLAELIEKRILNTLPKNGENGTKAMKILKPSEFPKLRAANGTPRIGTCLDKRLKKQLMEHGILSIEDLTKYAAEDEILTEINKCKQELVTVNSHNIEELNRLKKVVLNELHSNELREQLEKVDKQVLELYNKIVVTRKTAQQEEGDELDKSIFNEQVKKEFEGQADALLKEQINLNQQIDGLTDINMLY